jgi:uncharacterized protein YbbK (DUF523 family)/uncharacterized protein YbgA (DUF1722 family)
VSAPADRVRIGVSSCLLGEPVRFDGGHKNSRFVSRELSEFAELVPVCPEVEMGLSVPRKPMRLVRNRDAVRMLEIESGFDPTPRMEAFAQKRIRALRKLGLCGYVFKQDSPSCGAFRVKIHPGRKGPAERRGEGLFAGAVRQTLPWLPIEEEGRLEDAGMRDLFVERVFALRRLRRLFHGRWTAGQVVAFHTAHELQLMAHSPAGTRALGALVAAVRDRPRAEFREAYEALFLESFAKKVSTGRHVNVLQHMLGDFPLDARSRADLAESIEEFRRGETTLLVPLALIRHTARRLEVEYLEGQTYLSPEPAERKLRFRTQASAWFRAQESAWFRA